MRKPIERIIIAGGGSAGWMSAAMLSKQFPDMQIALVESPDIPTVGVGESTLGTINSFMDALGLKDTDWMKECDATYKFGIKFTDFYEKGQAFYYPFGIKDTQNTQQGLTDWYVKKTLNPETPNNDFYESFYSVMPLIYKNKVYDNADGQLPGFSFSSDVAYHMDATKFGNYLRDKICLPNGVVHIKEDIKEVNIDGEEYITGLKLSNGDVIDADLYLDCTGFKSMLLKGALNVPYDSFRDVLKNDYAWHCHLPYDDKEVEMENVTNCTAFDNGWVWNIPLYNRIGTGYVYDSKMYMHQQENDDGTLGPTNHENALEHFKEYLKNTDYMHFEKNVDELEFKHIKIENGCHRTAWKTNVVGVGLAYGFIEPLESTGLLSVQEVLLRLCETLHKPIVNRVYKDQFNIVNRQIMNGFRNFVGYHFTLSGRRDTEYWRQCTEWVRMDATVDDLKYDDVHTNMAEMANRMLQSHDLPGDPYMGGVPDIFVGMNNIPANPTQLGVLENLLIARNGEVPEMFSQQTQDYWDQKKQYIDMLAEDAPSHYQYLKDTIFEPVEVEDNGDIEEIEDESE